jgi:hypothetical protein
MSCFIPGLYLGDFRVPCIGGITVPLGPPKHKNKKIFCHLQASKSLPHSWNRTELPFFTFNYCPKASFVKKIPEGTP